LFYLVLKAIHIVSVVVFLGNMIAGLFWHAHAARTRDPEVLSHAMAGIIRSDRIFTNPGVVAILVSGVWLALLGRHSLLGTGWILWPIVLFSISGLAFMFRIAPLQRQLHGMAQAGAESGNFEYATYGKYARAWEFWGAVALLAPLAALAIMTLKLELWPSGF
jgi:uncharacterized membrane protein